MPIYEYECEECGEITEYAAPIGQAADRKICRVCGDVAHRVLSSFVPLFIGPGFHCNDYTSYGPREGEDA